MSYFVVISEEGPAWKSATPMREQEEWDEHATFMDSLAGTGFVVLGGPIVGGPTHRARLIVEASDEDEVRTRLAEDPWSRSNRLQISSIEKWDVLLRKGD